MLWSNRWRAVKLTWLQLIIEFPLNITLLTLFGISVPNNYHAKLRLEGARLGLNSDPRAAYYAAANHVPYHQPLVWSNFLANYNVVISVVSTLLLLIKATLHILDCLAPMLSLLMHSLLLTLYAFSVYGQFSSDISDPSKPQFGPPWFFTHSCDISPSFIVQSYCLQARVSGIVSCIALGLYGIYLLHAVISIIPSRKQILHHKSRCRLHKTVNSQHNNLMELHLNRLRNLSYAQSQSLTSYDEPHRAKLAPTPSSSDFLLV